MNNQLRIPIPPPERNSHRQSFARLAVSILLLSFCACAGETDSVASDSTASQPIVAASVATVEPKAFTETVIGVGTVTPTVGHVATLSAPAQSRVAAVLVAPGDKINAGATLVRFDAVTVDAAMTSADAALSAAREAAARAHRLLDAGVSPRKDAELADAQLAAANADAISARRAQSLSKLQSPIAGVVTRLNAVLGANVDAGQLLVEISDPSSVEIVISVSPSLATKIRAGQSVAVHDGSSEANVVIGTGRVQRVSAVVDSASRAVEVRVLLQSSTRQLRFGESVLAAITTDTHLDALVISDEAVVPVGEGFRVFVVDSSGSAKARDVVVGGRHGHDVWISDGIKAGDVVVTTGAYGMEDGARVAGKKP